MSTARLRANLTVFTTAVFVLSFSSDSFAWAATAQKVFVHRSAKFSFSYPARAKLTAASFELANCGPKDSIGLQWKNGALGVRALNMPLEKAINSTQSLEKDAKGEWFKSGRFDTRGKAIRVKFGKLSGLYATAICGVSDDQGHFHAAGGECLTAFLSDGKRTAHFETDGLFPVNTVVKVIMPSFKFTP